MKIKKEKQAGISRKIAAYLEMFVMVTAVFAFAFVMNAGAAGAAGTSGTASEIGCCFDAESGFCSDNSDRQSCTESGGNFYSSAACSTGDCTSGCCVLGGTAVYVTKRACEILSRTYGFEATNFQQTDSQKCIGISGSSDSGACVYEGDYENDCKFTTRAQCSGTFYQDSLCTEAELNTRCTKTGKTMCEEGNVYAIDSCGNREDLKDECDYSNGEVCKQQSKGSAFCKSMNCVDKNGKTRLNGEEWCLGTRNEIYDDKDTYCLSDGSCMSKYGTTEDGKEVPIPDVVLYVYTFTNGQQLKFRTYNLADYWGGTPSGGLGTVYSSDGTTATTDVNEYIRKGNSTPQANITNYICSNGTNHGDKITWYTPQGKEVEQYTDGWAEGVDEAVWKRYVNTNTIDSVYTVVESYVGANYPVGSEYYRQYCLNGEVYTEPCANLRYGVCDRGKCVLNDWEKCLDAGNSTEDCDEDYCYMNEGFSKTICVQPGDSGNIDVRTSNRKCIPKISSGLKFYDSESDDTNSSCSNGNFEGQATFYLNHDSNTWGGGSDDYWCGDATCVYFNVQEWLTNHKTPPSAMINLLEYAESRCKALGDCDGKVNFVDVSGSGNEAIKKTTVTAWHRTTTEHPGFETIKKYYGTYKLSYECEPFEAPRGSGDCGKCGADGLPCSEYRCKSLGQRCTFSAPAGVEKGYCTASDDYSSPQIISHSVSPESPIPPFTPAKITATTDEAAKCKFSIGTGQDSYEEMKHEFGKDFSTEHSVTLYLPGQKAGNETEGSETAYSLISKDGVYNMYVKCEDVVGNDNLAPYYIKFEVQKTPDTMPPIILKAEPATESAVAANASSKEVVLWLNEPAECKWSKSDEVFDSMAGEFSCMTEANDDGALNGYTCAGMLTGISTKAGSQTKYYIRCKDQPLLEDETGLYKRNANSKSYEYVLKASVPLKIESLNPANNARVIVTRGESSLDIGAATSGGGYGGAAECKWKLSSSSANMSNFFEVFEKTDAAAHSQTISSLSGGKYKLEVKCSDKAGNTAQATGEFTVVVDESAPKVTRAYSSGDLLKVLTDENAICKFTNDAAIGCSFSTTGSNMTGITEMSGASKEHTTEWKNNRKYYIKCGDYYGNENTGCGIIVSTY